MRHGKNCRAAFGGLGPCPQHHQLAAAAAAAVVIVVSAAAIVVAAAAIVAKPTGKQNQDDDPPAVTEPVIVATHISYLPTDICAAVCRADSSYSAGAIW